MQHPLEDPLGSPLPFLDRLFAALERDGLEVSTYELDHICYRVAKMLRYNQLKAELAGHGTLLGESIIGGRPIATFKLYTPIYYRAREIRVLELPAPKAGSPYPEGYEHVEFVVDRPLEQFVAQYPHLDFQTKGLYKAVNADVQLQYDGFGVKFHKEPLEEVIRQEQG